MAERQTAASSAVVAVAGSESESVSESLTMATVTVTVTATATATTATTTAATTTAATTTAATTKAIDIAPISSCLIITLTERDIILLIKGKNIGGNFVNVEQQHIGNIHYQQFLDMIVRNTSSDRYDQHPQAIHNIMETIHFNGGRFIQPYNYNKNKNNDDDDDDDDDDADDDDDDDDDTNTTDRGVAAALWCTIIDRDVIKNEILHALQNSRMKHNHRISGAGVLPAVPMVGTTTAAITGAGGRGGTSSSSSLSPPQVVHTSCTRPGAITRHRADAHHPRQHNLTKNDRTAITAATATAAATNTEANAVLIAADAAADANNKRKHCEDNPTDTNNKRKLIRMVVDQDNMRTCATSPSMNDHTSSLATTSIKTTVPETDTPNSNDLANTTTTITATAATMDGDKEDHTKNHGDDGHNGNSYDEEGNNPGANVRIENAVDDGKIGRNNGKSKTTQTVDCGHPEEDQDIANNEFPRDDEEDLDETLLGDVDGDEETNDDASTDDYDYEYDDDDNEREQNRVTTNHDDDTLDEDERYIRDPANNDAVVILNGLDNDRAGAVEVRLLEPPLNSPRAIVNVVKNLEQPRLQPPRQSGNNRNRRRKQARKDKAAEKENGGYAFKSRQKHRQEGGTIATAKTGEEARTCLPDAIYTLSILLIPTMKSRLSQKTVRSYFDMSGETKTDPNSSMAKFFCKGMGINIVHQKSLSHRPVKLLNAPGGVYLVLLKIILDEENEAFHYVIYDANKKEIYDNDRNTEIIVIEKCDLISNRSAKKAFIPLCPKAKDIWLTSVYLGCVDAASASSVAITQQVDHGAITRLRADAQHPLHHNLTKNHRTTTTVATVAATAATTTATTTTTTAEATAVLAAADDAGANNKRKHCEDNQMNTDNKSKRIRTVVDHDDMQTCDDCGVQSCSFSKKSRKKKSAVCIDCTKKNHEKHQAERMKKKKKKKKVTVRQE